MKALVAGLSLLLTLSLGMNLALLYLSFDQYKRLLLLRLDPVGAQHATIEVEQKVKTMVLFGDSRIAEWKPAREICDTRIVNRGIGGQTTAQLLRRLEEDVLAYEVDYVLIQAGINDLKVIGIAPNKREQIVRDVEHNILRMAEKARSSGVKPVLTPVISTGAPPAHRRAIWPDEMEGILEKVNAALKYGSLREGIAFMGLEDTALHGSQNIPSHYLRDFLHLNSIGYAEMEEALTEFLCGPLE